MNKLESIYIASPYSHSDKEVEKKRYDSVVAFVAKMMNREYVVYSPVVFGRVVALTHKLPTTWDYWKKFLSIQLKCHDTLLVLMLPEWQTSIGVREEIRLATEYGLSIKYANFDELTGEIAILENPPES